MSGARGRGLPDTGCRDRGTRAGRVVLAMTRSPTGWFDFGGDDPMIDAARELAPSWLAGLVPREDTDGWGGLCVLLRDVPSTRSRVALNCIEVFHAPADKGNLYGTWGDGNTVDLWPEDPEAQFLAEADESPQAQAETALAWIKSQLGRPIERRTWTRWGLAYEEVYLSDTDYVLRRSGPRRLTGMRRRSPDSITRIRP